jgi:hypothetical protein
MVSSEKRTFVSKQSWVVSMIAMLDREILSLYQNLCLPARPHVRQEIGLKEPTVKFPLDYCFNFITFPQVQQFH